MRRRTNRAATAVALLCGLVAAALATEASIPVRAQTAPPASTEIAVTSTSPAVADTYLSAPPSLRPSGGDAPRLVIDGSPQRQAFIRFAVPDYDGRLRSARLRLHVADLAGAGGVQGGVVSGSEDVTWSESGTTWATRPAADRPRMGAIGPVARNAWVEIPVTALVRRGQPLTLVLTSAHPGDVAYDARGTGSGPQLALDLDAPPDGVEVAAVGDMVCGPNHVPSPVECHQMEVSDMLVADPDLDAFLTLGDNQYPGGRLVDFQEFYEPSYGRVKPITHPSVGNHKHQVPGAAGYYDYFGAQAGPRGRGWYSFDLGQNWHLVALNSNCTEVSCAAGSPQLRWLREDLDANDRPCVLAYWHHPQRSSQLNPRHNVAIDRFWRLLYDHDAELVLNGHSHTYERMARQRPDGSADPHGIRQLIVGTGGRYVGQEYWFEGRPLPNSQFRLDRTFGLARLVLTDAGVWWSYVDEHGRVRDSGTDRCH